MQTQQNLKEAFAGESQANRKYLAYGEKAAQEGYPQMAKLFRAVAAAETIHANAHLRALDGIKDTLHNLQDAMAGEKYEFEEMYPGFIATAEAEGERRASIAMKHANEVEKVHYDLFGEALAAAEAGEDMPEASVRVCPVCGHTVIGDAPDQCPVCRAKGEKFMEIT